MITTKEQEALMSEISGKLTKKITTYAVGGNAMVYWGHKDATVDVDLVFLKETDRQEFEYALRSLGYTRMEASLVYADAANQPILLKRTGEERFDLFLKKVIRFDFSENMRQRARKIFEYGGNLTIKVADYHDVILMKCATDRGRDKEDIKMILESEKIDWNIIISEARHQIELGNGGSVFDILKECLAMKDEMGLKIPDYFFENVWDMFSQENIIKRKAREK